jgi:hypothetical protein
VTDAPHQRVVTVAPGTVLRCRHGAFPHAAWVGVRYGARVCGTKRCAISASIVQRGPGVAGAVARRRAKRRQGLGSERAPTEARQRPRGVAAQAPAPSGCSRNRAT